MGEPDELTASWLARALDARVLGRPLDPPAEQREACAAWMAEALPGEGVPARGLDPEGLPADWLDTLAWSGIPLAAHGELRWGTDIRQAAVSTPELKNGVLVLPPPDDLARLTSLALRPMRMFVAERLGCRLQAAPGIRLWLWPGRAALLSQSPIPLAGFLYSELPGHRASVALSPFGRQVVTW